MKKALLSITFLVAGAFSLLSQGVVQFDNGDWNFGDGVDRYIYAADGTKLNDPAFQVALFENRGGTWVQLGDRCTFDQGGFTVAGCWAWDGLDRVAQNSSPLPAPNGTSATLQVRLYDAQGNFVSQSADFLFKNAYSSPPGATDGLMMNFRGFAVPEPSTIALGVLGLGALLLFRRRQ